MQELGLKYRVLDMASEELGAAAFRKFDIEVWLQLILRVRKWLLLKLLGFLVLLDSTLNLAPIFLDLLSEFLFDGRDC